MNRVVNVIMDNVIASGAKQSGNNKRMKKCHCEEHFAFAQHRLHDEAILRKDFPRDKQKDYFTRERQEE